MMRESRLRAADITEHAAPHIIEQGSIGLSGVTVDILIYRHATVGDYGIYTGISCSGAMMARQEVAVLMSTPYPERA